MKKQVGRLGRGELEARVMNLLWDADVWCTPGDLHELLSEDHPVAYTTVMTTLSRLWAKGVLERTTRGRAYAYRPVSSRDELTAQRMQDILAAAGDRGAALTALVDGLSTNDRRLLRRILGKTRR